MRGEDAEFAAQGVGCHGGVVGDYTCEDQVAGWEGAEAGCRFGGSGVTEAVDGDVEETEQRDAAAVG